MKIFLKGIPVLAFGLAFLQSGAYPGAVAEAASMREIKVSFQTISRTGDVSSRKKYHIRLTDRHAYVPHAQTQIGGKTYGDGKFEWGYELPLGKSVRTKQGDIVYTNLATLSKSQFLVSLKYKLNGWTTEDTLVIALRPGSRSCKVVRYYSGTYSATLKNGRLDHFLKRQTSCRTKGF